MMSEQSEKACKFNRIIYEEISVFLFIFNNTIKIMTDYDIKSLISVCIVIFNNTFLQVSYLRGGRDDIRLAILRKRKGELLMFTKTKSRKRKKKLSSLIAASVLIPSLLLPSGFSSVYAENSSALSNNAISTSVKADLNTTLKNKVSSELLSKFDKEDRVTFLVKMKKQVDTVAVAKEAEKVTTAKSLTAAEAEIQKRSAIVSELRATATESQYTIIEYLEKQVEAGKAKDLQSFYIVNGIAVTATKDVMEQVALMEEVELISLNETVQLIQPSVTVRDEATVEEVETAEQTASIEWNIDQINAPEAWAMGIDGSGTVVASIDSGVQWNHPALKEKYRGYNASNPNSPSHEFNFFDATSIGGDEAYDDHGHGTHVTGTMVGSEPSGTNQIGVAPGAKWIAVKALSAAGSGTTADLLEAGEWILAPKDASGTPHPEMAPDVVNNSWGGGKGLNEWFRPMVQAWRAAEIFPEFSAGNTTLTNPGGAGSIAVPANYPESFATAATNNTNALASFSLLGPSPYGEVKPDISAPGVNIRSSVPGGIYEGGWNGTSMAGPHVAAVVALLKQVNANLTVDEIETILTETAVPLTDNAYPSVPNNGYGAGLVDAHAAVASIVDGLGTISGSVTIEGDDDESPSFTHEPVEESYKEMSLPLSITAADNVSVTSVALSYEKEDGTWSQIAAERTDGDFLSGTYEATLPGVDLTGDSVSYKFIITDFGGNIVETPVYNVALLNGISVGYFEDFESTPVGWTTFGTADWQWGVPTVGPESAYSGEKVYATNLAGTYGARANMSLEMPPIDLPEGNSYLQFKQWYNLERNYDFGHVFISTDGENYTQLARFNNLSNEWLDGEVDLSEYAGQRVYIQFNLTSDGSVHRPGWFIDDVALSDTPIESPEDVKFGVEKRNEAADKKGNNGLALGKDKNSASVDKPEVDPNKISPIKVVKEEKENTDEDKPALVSLPLSATVNVLETGRSVYTNPQDGSYRFVSSAGTFTLQASSYGYFSQTQSVTVERDGTSTANFVLEPVPQGQVTGTITNAQTGQAIEGATVFLVEDAAVAPVVTEEDGSFSLTAYEGSYTVKITAPGYAGVQTEVTIEGGGTSTLEFTLNPFIGYEGEIGYDDGTAENARAYNAAGNSWAVRMSLAEGESQANVTGALLRFWDTTWPNPGGTEIKVSVYDANEDGSPGSLIAGPIDGTALRDGNWTRVDLSEHGIMVEGDFYIVYTQPTANPNAPGLGTDEDGEFSGRGWQQVSGVWKQTPEAEGNYMIRAIVNYEVSAPAFTSPADGSYTNEEEAALEGVTSPNMTVEVYKGEEVAATVTAGADGKFSAPVTLAEGENTFTARVTTERGYSETSTPVTVTYDADAPVLTVTSPVDGSKSNRESVTVTGTIEDAYLDTVTVNGQNATVKDGKFSKRILLEEGLNTITVKATDLAGNEVEESVTIDVKYTAAEITNLVPTEDKVLVSGDTVKIEFDSAPDLDAVFSILMPLTNIVGTSSNALELPMQETSPGHYVGYYTATRNVVAPGAQIEAKVTDDYGNVTTQRASGLLYINQQ